jgi:hypothetical protein
MRLDLYSFDGSPMHPMYLAYRPPEMLPTTTLNPISSKRSKRDNSRKTTPTFDLGKIVSRDNLIDPNRLMWVGIIMSAMGGIAMFMS